MSANPPQHAPALTAVVRLAADLGRAGPAQVRPQLLRGCRAILGADAVVLWRLSAGGMALVASDPSRLPADAVARLAADAAASPGLTPVGCGIDGYRGVCGGRPVLRTTGPGSSGGRLALSVHRAAGDGPFRPADAAAVRLLHETFAGQLDADEPPAADRLGRRQRQTLDLLLAGLCQKEIARHLGISPHTVHQYVKDLYRIHGVSSHAELLARLLVRTGAAAADDGVPAPATPPMPAAQMPPPAFANPPRPRGLDRSSRAVRRRMTVCPATRS